MEATIERAVSQGTECIVCTPRRRRGYMFEWWQFNCHHSNITIGIVVLYVLDGKVGYNLQRTDTTYMNLGIF